MTDGEKLDLIRALLSRADLSQAGRYAFRQSHSDAPPEMIDTAAFHVYGDGVGAALDWLVAAEQFLRDPSRPLDYGATWHLIYHLYNWLQFPALLPVGRAGVLERLAEASNSSPKTTWQPPSEPCPTFKGCSKLARSPQR
jgi:hypothetical protein